MQSRVKLLYTSHIVILSTRQYCTMALSNVFIEINERKR
jgi:hypothetical protein